MAFPANELELTLAGVRAQTRSASQLLQALADNEVWVPLPAGANPDGTASLPIMMLDEQPFVAVYTSAEQFERGAGQQAHLVIAGRKLAETMAEHLGLAVNPGAELGLPIRPAGVQTLREGGVAPAGDGAPAGGVAPAGDGAVAERVVPAGGAMRLGAPAQEPRALYAALARVFVATPAVLAARRALAQVGTEAPTLLLGVHAEHHVAGWREAVLAAVRAAVREAPVPYAVEVVFLDDPTDPITAWMLANTEPIYHR